MSRERIRVVPHRRRREQKTDYRQRLGLLRSGKPRFVVRKTNNNIVCQIVSYKPDGDTTMVTATAADVRKMGWKGHGGNLPVAYLTGLLCGIRAKGKGVKDAVMDIGLHTSTKGSALYAALKGGLDAGIDIPHSEDVMPSAERVSGKSISEYRKQDVTKNFEETKAKIVSGKQATEKAAAAKPKAKPAKAK